VPQPQVVEPQVVPQPQVLEQVLQGQPPEDFPLDKEEFSERLRCIICYEKTVNIVLNPCGHLLCSSCYDNRLVEPKICPICTTNITSAINIFYGGYKQKYLKYKNKYLKLKNYKLL
jgi:hypothetical protein